MQIPEKSVPQRTPCHHGRGPDEPEHRFSEFTLHGDVGMSREGAPRQRGRRAAGCCAWLPDSDAGCEGPAFSPSAASSMVVWPYRSETSSSDQLKGTSGSERKEEGVFCALSCLCGHQLSLRRTERLQKKWVGATQCSRHCQAAPSPSGPASGTRLPMRDPQ